MLICLCNFNDKPVKLKQNKNEEQELMWNQKFFLVRKNMIAEFKTAVKFVNIR